LTKEIFRFLVMAAILTMLFPCMADALTIKTTQRLVVIDPGHGGKDHGIASVTGILEKQITLKLARMTARLLSDQYRSLLTRTTDVTLSATQRAAFANMNKADFFISIHLHTKENKNFFYYFGTPGITPADSDITWRTQGLEHQDKSRHAAVLFAKTFQDTGMGAKVHSGQVPAIPLEGLQMTAILAEPFTMSAIPVTTTGQDAFLATYAKMLTRSIEAYFKKQETQP